MVLCDNLGDIESSISTDLDCFFLYETSDAYFKVIYHAKITTLQEYKFYPELGNTFRLIKTMKLKNKQSAINIIRTWRKNNRDTSQILSRSDATLFKLRHKLQESHSCWKTPTQLKKAIEGGLEVPNCIPDSEYALDEAQIFINRKNRELMGKYKKAKDWFDEVLADGDKDFAEKIMQIIEKWKRNYEDKIRTVKGVLKEEEDYNKIFNQIEIDDYRGRYERSYKFYKNKIENEFEPPYREMYLTRLNTWYEKTKAYLEQKEQEVLNAKQNSPVDIHYTPFGFLDIDESFKIVDIQKILSENTIVQQQIQKYIDDEKALKSALAIFKNKSEYQKLPPEQKEKILKKFYDDFVKPKKKLTENFESADGDAYFKRDADASFYNDIMQKPEYMFWVKGYVGIVIYMTPDKYYERCARMQRTSIADQLAYIDKDVAHKYMEKMLDGEKFPMPYIDYSRKQQEGRHRSYAIKSISPEIKMPVLCVYDKHEDRKTIIEGVKAGDTFDEFVTLCKHLQVPYSEKYYNAIKNNTL